jgi:hypothetical protein
MALNVAPRETAIANENDRVVILMPVLDDWVSLGMLITRIDLLFADGRARFDIVAKDDGSNVGFVPNGDMLTGGCIDSLEVIHLAANLGHQRAIAVGLSLIARRDDVGSVLVMDSDGEDRPEDIATLLEAARIHPDHVILARRVRRSEGPGFRFGYVVYKLMFRLLTGKVINFGNFCLLPIAAVRSLVHTPDLWNNLAATIMRSRLRKTVVPTMRGIRLAGQSLMDLPALVIHGLSAMLVYSDLIFVRVLLACAMAGLAAVFGAVLVVLVHVTTSFGIPGWASNMMGDLLIILMQTVVIAVATTLTVLSNRSQRPIVPYVDAPAFVADRQRVSPTPYRTAEIETGQTSSENYERYSAAVARGTDRRAAT